MMGKENLEKMGLSDVDSPYGRTQVGVMDTPLARSQAREINAIDLAAQGGEEGILSGLSPTHRWKRPAPETLKGISALQASPYLSAFKAMREQTSPTPRGRHMSGEDMADRKEAEDQAIVESFTERAESEGMGGLPKQLCGFPNRSIWNDGQRKMEPPKIPFGRADERRGSVNGTNLQEPPLTGGESPSINDRHRPSDFSQKKYTSDPKRRQAIPWFRNEDSHTNATIKSVHSVR